MPDLAVAHIAFRPLTPQGRALLRATEAFQWVGMAAAGAAVAMEDLAESLSRTPPELAENGECSDA